ncbi:MAG: hypothetical protein ACFCU3_08135 [Verrucomicrobiales bacterium]
MKPRPQIYALFGAALPAALLGGVFLLAPWKQDDAVEQRFEEWQKVAVVEAGEVVVWTAMLLATNDEKPRDMPELLRPWDAELRALFGYNAFRLVSSDTSRLKEHSLQWFLPRERPLYFSITKLPNAEPGPIPVNVQIYREKQWLVDTEAQLVPGTPLLVKGPMCRRGQIIFVILIGEGSEQEIQSIPPDRI